MKSAFTPFLDKLLDDVAAGLGIPNWRLKLPEPPRVHLMSTKSTESNTRRTVSVTGLLPRPDSETSRSCFISYADACAREGRTFVGEAEQVEVRMRLDAEEMLSTAGLIHRLRDTANRQAKEISDWKLWAGHAQHVAVERLELLEKLAPASRKTITTRER